MHSDLSKSNFIDVMLFDEAVVRLLPVTGIAIYDKYSYADHSIHIKSLNKVICTYVYETHISSVIIESKFLPGKAKERVT